MKNAWGILTLPVLALDLLPSHSSTERAPLSSVFETPHGTLKV